jgi:hypothetical protein
MIAHQSWIPLEGGKHISEGAIMTLLEDREDEEFFDERSPSNMEEMLQEQERVNWIEGTLSVSF